MAKLNKSELIEAVKNETGLKSTEAEKAVNIVLDTIKKTVKAGDEAGFVGFGTFKTVKRAARTGKNPQTQKPIKIPAKTVVKFKPSKNFLD